MREATSHQSGSRPTKTNATTDTTITTSRKAVPQRGCAVGYLRISATSRGSPRSWAWTVMCSAPWYMKTRRMSFMRPMRTM